MSAVPAKAGLSWDTTVAANAISQPCACGRDVVCVGDAQGIKLGVRAHQVTPEHRAWRASFAASGWDFGPWQKRK